MATQVFFLETVTTPTQWGSGTNNPNLGGGGVAWAPRPLGTARGGGIVAAPGSTILGPTNGEEIGTSGGIRHEWISPPLSAAVTISGTITFNLWSSESSMNANVAINCIIERLGPDGAIISTVVKTARVTELGTSIAAANFTATPTSTSFAKGDRIRIRVFGDDAGTMAASFTFAFDYNAASAGVDGDSYVTFTETFSFMTSDPSTQHMYLANRTSDIDPGGAGTDTKELWTTAGTGSFITAVTNTAAGWTAPIQITKTAGGNLMEWFTRQLGAFTLSGPTLFYLWWKASTSGVAAFRAEIAICDSAGTLVSVWGATSYPTGMDTTDNTPFQLYVCGDDVAITDGQRLRVRLFIDDPSASAMSSGFTATLDYDSSSTTPGNTGMDRLTFGQTLTEFTSGPSTSLLPSNRRRRLSTMLTT